MEPVSVFWWWLGVLACLTAGVLLVRPDAIAYRRQWIASGKTSGSWWVNVARRLLITWAVFGVFWLVLVLGLRVAFHH